MRRSSLHIQDFFASLRRSIGAPASAPTAVIDKNSYLSFFSQIFLFSGIKGLTPQILFPRIHIMRNKFY